MVDFYTENKEGKFNKKTFKEKGGGLFSSNATDFSSMRDFKSVIIQVNTEDDLKKIIKRLKDGKNDNVAFTIVAKEGLSSVDEVRDLIANVNILFDDDLNSNCNRSINKDKESNEFFTSFLSKKEGSILHDSNPNFENDTSVISNSQLIEGRQGEELIAVANRFIAFEYYDDSDNIKNKYNGLELEQIHSSFKAKDKNELIKEARDAVCGGKYDITKFNQAKKESIYNGVDKFKASIDNQGYLVIQSVGENINDANFQKGVKTNFKFKGCEGKEITQDNLIELFTDDSDGKDSTFLRPI